MKSFIEKIIQLRNPSFKFSSEINTRILIRVVWDKSTGILRGLKTLTGFKIANCLVLERGTSLKNINHLQLGKWVQIGEFTTIDAFGRNGVTIGDNSSIGSFSRLVVTSNYSNIGSHINIGDNVGIGAFANIGGSGGITIGKNTIIAQYFSAHPENHIFESTSKPIRSQGTSRKPIVIGEDCWIGAKVTIVAGISIGRGAIIGAGSVVTKDIPDFSIAVGNPARTIKSRSQK